MPPTPKKQPTAKPIPVTKPNKPVLEPIPKQYAQMPEDVARAMMASDKENLAASFKKTAARGTVSGSGKIQQSTSKPSTRGGAGYIGIGGKKT